MDASELVTCHEPPDVASLSVVDPNWQMVAVPVTGATTGKGVIVIGRVAEFVPQKFSLV
jgi:hypothetical protein